MYYESLCPDSARFITEQLHPVKSSPLGRFLDVKLIPFGKASVSIYTFIDLHHIRIPIDIECVYGNQKYTKRAIRSMVFLVAEQQQ